MESGGCGIGVAIRSRTEYSKREHELSQDATARKLLSHSEDARVRLWHGLARACACMHHGHGDVITHKYLEHTHRTLQDAIRATSVQEQGGS